jgi:hypothetical protein
MAYIFSNSAGRASVITDTVSVPVTAAITDGSLCINMAAQSFLIRTSANYQLLPTLRAVYYMYVFGEYPADATINGICFATDCNWRTNGVSSAIEYYANHGLYYRQLPLYLQVGAAVFPYSYLVGGEFELMNPETNLGRFTYQLKLAPP